MWKERFGHCGRAAPPLRHRRRTPAGSPRAARPWQRTPSTPNSTPGTALVSLCWPSSSSASSGQVSACLVGEAQALAKSRRRLRNIPPKTVSVSATSSRGDNERCSSAVRQPHPSPVGPSTRSNSRSKSSSLFCAPCPTGAEAPGDCAQELVGGGDGGEALGLQVGACAGPREGVGAPLLPEWTCHAPPQPRAPRPSPPTTSPGRQSPELHRARGARGAKSDDDFDLAFDLVDGPPGTGWAVAPPGGATSVVAARARRRTRSTSSAGCAQPPPRLCQRLRFHQAGRTGALPRRARRGPAQAHPRRCRGAVRRAPGSLPRTCGAGDPAGVPLGGERSGGAARRSGRSLLPHRPIQRRAGRGQHRAGRAVAGRGGPTAWRASSARPDYRTMRADDKKAVNRFPRRSNSLRHHREGLAMLPLRPRGRRFLEVP